MNKHKGFGLVVSVRKAHGHSEAVAHGLQISRMQRGSLDELIQTHSQRSNVGRARGSGTSLQGILAYGCESMMLETSISLHAAQGTDIRQAALDGANKESWMETLNRAENSFTHMAKKKKKNDVRRHRLRARKEKFRSGILRQSKYAADKAPAMRA